MIELLYFASQIQCGAGGAALTIQVDVYHNQELVETMMVDDRVLVPVNSVNDLNFEYSIVNNTTNCNSLKLPSELVLAPEDEIPNYLGFDQQDSIPTLLSGLNEYEELFLIELGSTDETSTAFDMQDVIFKIDNNPNPVSRLYPD